MRALAAVLAPTTLILTTLLSACRPADADIAKAIQRDSAGIIIAENPAEMEIGAGGWNVDPEPFLSIGSVEGDEATILWEVMGAHRMVDGRVAILNQGSAEIRIFDGTGTLVGNLGGHGEGPGEFVSMALAGVLGDDTLVIGDRSQRRLSLIHPDLGFLRSGFVEPEVAETAYPSGVFSNGLVVFGVGARPTLTDSTEEGLIRRPLAFTLSNLDGTFAGPLAERPGDDVVQEVMESSFDGHLWVRELVILLARQPQVRVSGNWMFFGSQDRFEIEVLDSEGTTHRLIRVLEEPTPITDAAWTEYYEERIEKTARDEEHARERRQWYQDYEYVPDRFPAHGALQVDALDHLWVEEYRLPREEWVVWSVFDPEGARVARVNVPLGLEVLEIGEDYLMGKVKDEYDVEYVQLLSLHRGS